MSSPILESPQAPTPPPSIPLTPEDLLKVPDGHRFELVGGQLVERNMGAESSEVAGNVIHLLKQHVRPQKLGKVFPPDCGYQCFPGDPKKVRYADTSFIARGRLPGERTPKGHVTIAPDLAVEVVSPNDSAEEVETKRIEYLQAGVHLVWIVYPENQTVHVYRQSGDPTILGASDELTGEAVLPGFRCKVAELFEDM
jgi:Uma2 family endonuclease